MGLVVICGLSGRIMHNNVRAMEYEQAYRLLDECLDGVLAKGTGQIAAEKKLAGDFGQRYPNYTYTLELEPTDTPRLYKITGTVMWYAAEKRYTVETTTLMFETNRTGI